MRVVAILLRLRLQRLHLLAKRRQLQLQLGDQPTSLLLLLHQLISSSPCFSYLLVTSRLDQFFISCHRPTVATLIDFGKLSRTHE